MFNYFERYAFEHIISYPWKEVNGSWKTTSKIEIQSTGK